MAPNPATAARKMVTGRFSLKHGPAPLAVNKFEGEWWATNRYWAVRASRVAALLASYNLPADEPGAYEADNAGVRRARGDNNGEPVIPNLADFMARQAGGDLGIRARVAGCPMFDRDDNGQLWAMFALADGGHAGIKAEELEWLSDLAGERLPEGHRFGSVRVLFRRSAATGHVTATIQAEVVKVLEKGHYEPGASGKWVEPVEEPAGPYLLGLVTARSYGDA
jgi:hypothetical protein